MPTCPSSEHTEGCQDQLVASDMTTHSWAVPTNSCWPTSKCTQPIQRFTTKILVFKQMFCGQHAQLAVRFPAKMSVFTNKVDPHQRRLLLK